MGEVTDQKIATVAISAATMSTAAVADQKNINSNRKIVAATAATEQWQKTS